MSIQDWIHQLEQGAVARVLKLASVLMGFVALALFYDLGAYQGLTNPEAMEAAHLGHQLAEGKGYTTDSIRPLAIYLLQQADPAHATEVLRRPVPDLSVAPGYPFLLAGLMKVAPISFTATRDNPWFYQPDLWIVVLNEFLFFVAVILVFQVARRLFDEPVAWLSSVIFAGSELYWKFSVSGLSTMWMMVLFLGVVWCLIALEARERQPEPPGLGGSLALALATGALTGIGGLSRYSFVWLILPVVLFGALFLPRARGKLCSAMALAFLVAMAPWLTRNFLASHHFFGTADYASMETTSPLPGDQLERSLDPAGILGRVTPGDLVDKLLSNGREILAKDLPRLGGNWIPGFFLCGLLMSYRSVALKRFRYFLLWSLILCGVVQAGGRTHWSEEFPEISSENLLAVVAPLVMIYGAGVFFTLLDHIEFAELKAKRGVVWLFGVILCGPLILTLFGAKSQTAVPYAPFHIQRTAEMMGTNELMMSDIPWAVAWYGGRPCVWLTLDDRETFDNMNKLKPIQAVYLTEHTSDRRLVSQMLEDQRSWESFYLGALPPNLLESLSGWAKGEVPTGFPLRKECLDYLPEEMFISDHNRWSTAGK